MAERGLHKDSRSAPGSGRGDMSRESYVDLANFRLALRRFLAFSEAAVGSVGITSQQYQALLAIKASVGERLAIKDLAEQLLLAPNGAVQLVDRLESQALVSRQELETDRRVVLVALTEQGGTMLEKLAVDHVAELALQKPLLAESLRRLKAIRR